MSEDVGQDVLPAPRKLPRAKAGPTTTQKLLAQQQVLELSRAGKKCPAIGALLGMSRQQAHKHLQRALLAVREEIAKQADELRIVELDRLDALLFACWQKATASNPDWQAMDRVLKIMERRARLLGLDAPIRLTTPRDQPFELAAVTSTGPALLIPSHLAALSEQDLTSAFLALLHEPLAALPAPRDPPAAGPRPAAA